MKPGSAPSPPTQPHQQAELPGAAARHKLSPTPFGRAGVDWQRGCQLWKSQEPPSPFVPVPRQASVVMPRLPPAAGVVVLSLCPRPSLTVVLEFSLSLCRILLPWPLDPQPQDVCFPGFLFELFPSCKGIHNLLKTVAVHPAVQDWLELKGNDNQPTPTCPC